MPVQRSLRYVLFAVLAVIVIAGGAIAVMIARFDPNEYKDQIVQAVKQATGRDLALNGRIGLKLSLTPTMQLQDVALANPAGFSRPQMATLERLDVQLALLPLLSHKVEIDRLILVKPDILLETDAAGHNNWTFAPERPAGTKQTETKPGEATGKPAGAPPAVSIGAVGIQDGVLGMRDGKTGSIQTIALPALDILEKSPDAPLHADASVVTNGVTFDLVADTGSLSDLRNAAAPPWPFKVALAIKGAPLGDTMLNLTGTVGAPAMLSGKEASFPIDLTIQSAGATLSAKGSIADAVALTGAKIALAVRIPDLSGLSPLVGRALPPLKDIVLTTNVTDAAGGLANGIALHDIALTAPAADLAGDIQISRAGKPSVTAVLKSNRIDVDALQATAPAAPVAPGPAATKAPAPLPPPQPRQGTHRIFSDEKLPFGDLAAADADITLTVGTLRSGGVDYKSIDARAVVQDGKLTMDPFVADLPGGHLSGTLTAEAQPPAVHLTLHAPGLAVKSLLALAHQQPIVSGNLEVFADLHGSGDTPHAIASTLDGYLGLAIANGSVDSKVMTGIFGNVLDAVNAINVTGHRNGNDLKCFAVRLDANNGVGTFKALALDSSMLTMTGTGSVSLGAETVDTAMRAQVRAGGAGVLVLPLDVTGPMTAPSVKVNAGRSATANAGSVAGAVLGNATPLGIVAGIVGADKMIGLGAADVCPAALAAARGQPAPAAEAEPAPAPKSAPPGLPNAAGLLKNLFR